MTEQLDGISVVVGILLGILTVVVYTILAAFVDLLTDVEDDFDTHTDQAIANSQDREVAS